MRNPNLPESHWQAADVVAGLEAVAINHEVHQALGYLLVGAPAGGVCLSDQAVADVLRTLRGAGLEIVRNKELAFMCRDGHTQIWHKDSSLGEMCPVCLANAEVDRMRDVIRQAHYACTKSSLSVDKRLYDATSILAKTGINR